MSGDIEDVHLNIADNLAGHGGYLECQECGHRQSLGGGETNRYLISGHLATGWPKHCGYTMRWITARQAKEMAELS